MEVFEEFCFFRHAKPSPSGEWYINCRDGDGKGLCGFRYSGHGKYTLYNHLTKQVVLTGKLERPVNATVANNGTFCIEDSLFGDTLDSILYVFLSDGEKVIEKRLGANIFNSQISDDGQYVVFQTCNNTLNDDGNKLFLLEVNTGKVLFCREPATGWASKYFLDTKNKKLGVSHVSMDSKFYFYDFDGNFIDQSLFDADILSRGGFYEIVAKVQEIFSSQKVDEKTAFKLISALQVAIKSMYEEKFYAVDAAKAYKLMGEIYETIGDEKGMLCSFEQAINFNPKIGLKRKVAALKVKLNN